MDPVIIMAGETIADAKANIAHYQQLIAAEEQRIIDAGVIIAKRNKEQNPFNRSYVMVVDI